MKHVKDRPILILLLLSVAISVAVIIYSSFSFDLDIPSVLNQSAESYENNWVYDSQIQSAAITSLPVIIETKEAVLTNTLPDELSDDSILLIETSYPSLVAAIDGNVIYEGGLHTSLPFGSVFGTTSHMIPVSSSDAGKSITLSFTSNGASSFGSVDSILSGSKSAVLLHVLRTSLTDILLCLSTLILGAICLLHALFLTTGKKESGNINLLYLGMFIILSSLFAYPQIRTLFLFTSSSVSAYLITYLSFLLAPIPLLLFFKSVFQGGKKILEFLALLFLYNFISQLLLFVLNKADPVNTMILTHILLVISYVVIVTLAVIEIFRYNSRNFELLIGCCSGAAFTFVDIARYYTSYTDQIGSSYFFRFGLWFLTAAMLIYLIRERAAVMNALSEIEMYQHLAYVDGITKLSNRAAYDKELLSLQKNLRSYTSVAFIVFDLNNLKVTNDTYGHSAGDELIVLFADCLSETFRDIGKCFRTGGDEFVITMVDKSDTDVELILRQLKNAVDLINMSSTYAIDYACGYALDKLDHPRPETLYRLLKQADFNMYAQKRVTHSIRVNAES